jgi:hypothetical protein
VVSWLLKTDEDEENWETGLLCYILELSQSQSQSHIATDGQSVCLGVEPKSGIFDQGFVFKVTVLSLLGRPL